MAKSLLVRFAKQIASELLKGNLSTIANLSYYQRWKNSLEPGKNSVSDEQPWITFPVIDLLDKNINNRTNVFEYGGGGSTLFFTNRAKEVMTVEHDEKWFSILEQLIAAKKINSWKGQLILPQKDETTLLDPSNPNHYYTDDAAFKDFTFKKYASFIDSYPEAYFDIVLVDGRSRPSCIHHSLSKIKQGGLLIIDNSDRVYYFTHLGKSLKKQFKLHYNKKAPSPYADFFTQTGVWQKL